MNSLMLAADVGSFILLGVLVLFLIVSPFLMRNKNKKEMEAAQKMLDSIKKGDEVLTASGVIGKVVSIDNKNKFGYKTVTIETGDASHKGYFTLDAQAIYANLSNPEVIEPKKEETKETEEVKEEVSIEPTEEIKAEEKVEEKPAENKKPSTKKKSTNKKSGKKTTKKSN